METPSGLPIAAALGISKGVVTKYAGLAAAAELDWAAVCELDEAEQERRLLTSPCKHSQIVQLDCSPSKMGGENSIPKSGDYWTPTDKILSNLHCRLNSRWRVIMAINGIQFQKGLSLAQFMKDYGTACLNIFHELMELDTRLAEHEFAQMLPAQGQRSSEDDQVDPPHPNLASLHRSPSKYSNL